MLHPKIPRKGNEGGEPMNVYRWRYIKKHKMEFVREKIAYHILDRMGYCWADLVFWYQDQSRAPFSEVSKPYKQTCIECNYCGRGFKYMPKEDRLSREKEGDNDEK